MIEDLPGVGVLHYLLVVTPYHWPIYRSLTTVLLTTEGINIMASERRTLFTYELSGDYHCPDCKVIGTQPAWQIDSFIDLKTRLNTTKDSLSNIDIIQWRSHTTFTHKGGDIITELKRSVAAELCTQAWCKFYEILAAYDTELIQISTQKKLYTLHVCEAPGAFISALNHFLKTKRHKKLEWHWLAKTLNPYYEGNSPQQTIMDDRLYVYTMTQWDVGVDDTGDITVKENYEAFKGFKQSAFPNLLVTGDGGINCQDDPAEQEMMVAKLKLCEVATSLSALEVDGHFVLKMFTFFEHVSVSILYFLACVFEKVEVVKPVTSKAGNSEVYLVCLRRKIGRLELQPYLDKLFEYAQSFPNTACVFPLDSISAAFMDAVFEMNRVLFDRQTACIEENVRTFHVEQERADQWRSDVISQKQDVAQRFKDLYNPAPLRAKDKLHTQYRGFLKRRVFSDSYLCEGSFNDRVRQPPSWNERLDQLRAEFMGEEPARNEVHNLPMKKCGIMTGGWECDFYKPYQKLLNTPFVCRKLLSAWNELRAKVEMADYRVDTRALNVSQYGLKARKFYLLNAGDLTSEELSFESNGGDCEGRQWCYTLDLQNSNFDDCSQNWANLELIGKVVMKVMETGDSLFIAFSHLLTRFGVGLLYIMEFYFMRTGVVTVVDGGKSACAGIVCSDLLYFSESHPRCKFSTRALYVLAEEARTVTAGKEDPGALLSIVYTDELLEVEFFEMMKRFNDELVTTQIRSFISRS